MGDTMELTGLQIALILLTMLIIIGSGILSSRKIRTSAGFSLNGRSASAPMVAGAIAGASIGGGSTIGTSQLAFTMGLSALWFTLGLGIGLVFLAVCFARPLRESGYETVSQVLISSYGRQSGPVASIIASTGIFFSCLASVLPAIWILSAILDISVYVSGLILMILIAVYIYFGGMKGTAVSGLVKTFFIWSMLLVITFVAGGRLASIEDPGVYFPESFWFDLTGCGMAHCLENVFSLMVGITCSQTYVQALFSAKDVKTARIGIFFAAAVSMPVGIPCAMAAMYMHAMHPEINPILALPIFAITYLHPVLAGITLGALIMSLISSVSGLTFGISTMLSRDIVAPLLALDKDEQVLKANKILIIVISAAVILFAFCQLHSQVLMWNFLSMSLRGSIFIPLIMAILGFNRMAAVWAIPAMLVSTLSAILAQTVLNISIPPLFVAFIASSTVVIAGMTASRKINRAMLKLLGKIHFLRLQIMNSLCHGKHRTNNHE